MIWFKELLHVSVMERMSYMAQKSKDLQNIWKFDIETEWASFQRTQKWTKWSDPFNGCFLWHAQRRTRATKWQEWTSKSNRKEHWNVCQRHSSRTKDSHRHVYDCILNEKEDNRVSYKFLDRPPDDKNELCVKKAVELKNVLDYEEAISELARQTAAGKCDCHAMWIISCLPYDMKLPYGGDQRYLAGVLGEGRLACLICWERRAHVSIKRNFGKIEISRRQENELKTGWKSRWRKVPQRRSFRKAWQTGRLQ